MLRRMRSKKGFTLAELLIVVAIIAILVAIAVPLFVGSLQKAQKATEDANIRAVRGAATVYLLENTSDKTNLWTADAIANGWDVTAEITSSGEITGMTVTPNTSGTVADPSCTKPTKEGSKNPYEVKLHIANTEVTANASSSSSSSGGLGG